MLSCRKDGHAAWALGRLYTASAGEGEAGSGCSSLRPLWPDLLLLQNRAEDCHRQVRAQGRNKWPLTRVRAIRKYASRLGMVAAAPASISGGVTPWLAPSGTCAGALVNGTRKGAHRWPASCVLRLPGCGRARSNGRSNEAGRTPRRLPPVRVAL